ncbi:glycosyltransferase [Methylomagnum sp.]
MFCPGLAQARIDKHASPRLTIVPRPVRLNRLISACDLALCHAGHGTVCGMLQAGIPLLLLPTNLEQYMTARRVEECGAGLVAPEPNEKPDYLALIGEILNRGEYRVAAQNFAAQYSEHTQAVINDRILTRLLALVG